MMSTTVELVQATPSQKARDLLRQLYHLIQQESGRAPALGEFFPVAVDLLVTKVLKWELEFVDLVGSQFTNDGQFIGPNHGEADPATRRILVSTGKGGEEEKRFTIAHEVGHAVLHADRLAPTNRTRSVRPVDRRAAMSPQPLQQRLEREADVFAAALLMPEKAVRTRFKELFAVDRMRIQALLDNVATVPNMRAGSYSLREQATEIARRKSRPEEKSLAEFFGVSSTAMAIRICELRLIQ